MTRIAASLVLTACLTGAAAAAPADLSPAGNWRTFDDVDGKESGAVHIFEQNGAFYGTITRITDPTKQAALCTLCTDDRKDQPILGLQVVRGLKPDGDSWDGGEVVDPKTGKIYRASMKLQDGGKKLAVRGYIGVSLLGRTQTWIRQ